MGLQPPSSCVWNIVHPIPYAELSVFTDYVKFGRGKAKTGGEHIVWIIVLNDLSFSSFRSNCSSAPLQFIFEQVCDTLKIRN